ncbi:MAG TPA: TraB/GumN family protein [Chitinophagaceae bacterium]|jgi:uncharacterized protein YbaP (TraB family)
MTQLKTFLLFILLCCAAFFSGQAQVQSYPSTLLWRISGNHLSKPSYLYGTMHITDRRIFYFGDSLYSCLEKAEGYAMEINPDAAIRALFQSIYNNDTTGLVKDAVSKEAFSKMSKRMETELGVPANKVTRKQLWLYSYKGNSTKKDDDMDAPVDTYLYNIARRQGKWVGGIEDVQDQLNLLEKLGSQFNADALLYKADGKTDLERMTGIYKDQDLNKINTWMASLDPSYRNDLLNRRNKKMAHRIDSMAAIRSNFFAVGAAHLPGTEGLLALLRAKGYTLTPIISSRKIAPEAYTYTPVKLPWDTLEDDDRFYTVQMPGKAFPIKLPRGITMQCYVDAGTGLTYFSVAMKYPVIVRNTDSVLSLLAKNIANSGNIEKQTSITYNGAHGLEIFVNKSESYFYRLRAFLKDEALYMVMTGSQKKILLENSEGERFLNSLVMHERPKAPLAASKGWTTFMLPEKGFTIELPGKPELNKQMEQAFHKNGNSSNWGFVCYSYSDASTGNYYLVTVREAIHGYYLSSDTSIFSETKRSIFKQASILLAFDTLIQQGYPAMKLDVFNKQTDLTMSTLTLCRANRVYTMMALSEKGRTDSTSIRRFMNSLRLTDYLPAHWSDRFSPDSSFHTWTPMPIAKSYQATLAGDSSGMQLETTDSLSSISYHIDRLALPPHYRAKSDSSFFADRLKSQLLYADLVLSKYPVENGGIKGMEYIIQSPGSNNLKRLRMFPAGDSMYRIYTFLPRQMLRDPDVEKFFTSFRISREDLLRSSEDMFKKRQRED